MLESITMIIPHCLHLPEAVSVQALFLFVIYYSVNLHLSAPHVLVHVQVLSPALVKVLCFFKFFFWNLGHLKWVKPHCLPVPSALWIYVLAHVFVWLFFSVYFTLQSPHPIVVLCFTLSTTAPAKRMASGRNKRFLETTDDQNILFTKEDNYKAEIIRNVIIPSFKLIAVLKIMILLTTLLLIWVTVLGLVSTCALLLSHCTVINIAHWLYPIPFFR